jgi:ketopantoate reductase
MTKYARISVVVRFPSTISSDQAFEEWLRAIDKVTTPSGVTPMYSDLKSVHNTETEALNGEVPAESDT